MKQKIKIVIEWIAAAYMVLFALVSGSIVPAILFLIAGMIIAPIKPVRKFIREKLKINKVISIILAVVLFFGGCIAMPTTDIEEPEKDSGFSSIFDTEDLEDDESSTTETTTLADESSTSETTTENSTTTTTKVSGVGDGNSKPVSSSKVPAFSGKAYTYINGNQPNFSSAELTTKAYEKYSELDSLGRCGVAIASCGKEIMPAEGEERGSISSIKPSGWKQAKYSGISGGYLWNRCHLIGWQLSAENANRKNLITGTRYMNINGMLVFENMIADYIKETDNHVAYRVTPIFEGNNLVCSGVQLEAYSIEDNGDGICFNVYCYNVQPGIVINYADGSSYASGSNETTTKKTETTTKKETTTKHTSASEETGDMVWIPQSGKKYHSYSGCSGMKNPSKVSRSDAEDMGYTPCKKCW